VFNSGRSCNGWPKAAGLSDPGEKFRRKTKSASGPSFLLHLLH
jgi:hypothetical protein